MTIKKTILNVALPVPLRRSFDYRVSDELLDGQPEPGVRVNVPFGRSRNATGIVIDVVDSSTVPEAKLKYIRGFIDREPVFDTLHMQWLTWASQYYQHPVGEVIFNAMPAALRQGKAARPQQEYCWQITDAGRNMAIADLGRAPRQAELLGLFQSAAGDTPQLPADRNWQATLKALADKGFVEKVPVASTTEHPGIPQDRHGIVLNPEQAMAVDTIWDDANTSGRYLLNGVTGSGKTEVYIELIKRTVAAGKQALVLVPEIGLTPQLIRRVTDSVPARIAVLHSSLAEGERLQNWLAARDGTAAVLLGTRSAVWTPMQDPGVIIIDEEHDQSYKQQDGFRYSARDIAIMRAKLTGVKTILGSATPSMESLHNVNTGNYKQLLLPSRTGTAPDPVVGIIDMRACRMTGAFSETLLDALAAELDRKHQCLVFLNRRGYSPVIMCHGCGWTATCNRCERHMTYHKHLGRYTCHHCDRQLPFNGSCPDCGAEELLQVGHGTERLEDTLAHAFPRARILRIDRDSTRRRGSMDKMLDAINAGDADILIGTQMLAKGHHFPRLTLVGIIDTDRGLYSTDFRASERMAQLFMQVSGRAGRADKPGHVLVQTHEPEHPVIQALQERDYNKFARFILQERELTGLPPYSYMAVLRAEDYRQEAVLDFLEAAKRLLDGKDQGLAVQGPLPAILEKRAGRLRYQLVIQCDDRSRMSRALEPWAGELEALKNSAKVRWSIDVDPQDLY